MTAEIVLSCPVCAQKFLRFTHDPNVCTEVEWRSYLKQRYLEFDTDGRPKRSRDISCNNCGTHYDIDDDGTPAAEGGGLVLVNVSRPKITELDVSSGPAAGGTQVSITGESLDVGTLVVRFGDEAASINSRTATSAQVTTPAGSGTVDVSAENDYGQRDNGSTLAGAFTYT